MAPRAGLGGGLCAAAARLGAPTAGASAGGPVRQGPSAPLLGAARPGAAARRGRPQGQGARRPRRGGGQEGASASRRASGPCPEDAAAAAAAKLLGRLGGGVLTVAPLDVAIEDASRAGFRGCAPAALPGDAAAAAAAKVLRRLGGGLLAVAPLAAQLPVPLFCRPLPLFCKTRRVRFCEELNTEHEVTPYAEVYGRHPRHFVFDRDSHMVAAAPCGFVGARSRSCGMDEDVDLAPEVDSPIDGPQGDTPDAFCPVQEEIRML